MCRENINVFKEVIMGNDQKLDWRYNGKIISKNTFYRSKEEINNSSKLIVFTWYAT